MEARFRERLVAEITANDLRKWLKGLPLAAKTRNKHRGYAGQIFNLAIDFGHARINPVSKIKKFGERSSEETGEVSVLTAADTQKQMLPGHPIRQCD